MTRPCPQRHDATLEWTLFPTLQEWNGEDPCCFCLLPVRTGGELSKEMLRIALYALLRLSTISDSCQRRNNSDEFDS